MKNRIERGHAVIFLDFKAEFDLVAWLYGTAKTYGREGDIRLLSLSNRDLSVPYNPIKNGDRSDIHSALMNSMTWSESFYRSVASVALMTVVSGLCEYREKSKRRFHLGHIYELLNDSRKLRAFAAEMTRVGCRSSEEVQIMAAQMDKSTERTKFMGLIANLNQLINSAAGELISHDAEGGSFDFREAIQERRITYMLMNSLKLKESASVFGKLILQDLMQFVGEHYSRVDQSAVVPVTLVIDEFASFATPEFIEFMDRARGAGIGIVMAHQSRADLREISPDFQSRIEANANTVIVSGVKTSEDAEHYAGMLGTKTTIKETIQVKDEGFWSGERQTGMKSRRNVEEFVLHPNILKGLKRGEVFVNSSVVRPNWGLIRAEMAIDPNPKDTSPAVVMDSLKAIRKSYLSEAGEACLDIDFIVQEYAKRQALQGEGAIISPKKETWD